MERSNTSGLDDVGRARVRLSLRQFMREYDVTEYPVDSFRLVQKIRKAGRIHLEVREEPGLSGAVHGSSAYFPEVDSYLIVIRPVPEGWQKQSPLRRCNFTLAHELGHVFCGHLDLPESVKSAERIRREDLEADEFAAELLMPERMVLQSRFSSVSQLAEAFLVSEQACRRRLSNLKLPGRAGAAEPPSCSVCGNGRISPSAEYCGICGALLAASPQTGVRVVEYPRYLTDENHRVLVCPACGNGNLPDRAQACPACGLPVYNYCMSDHFFKYCRRANAANARYCERCGCKTEYYLRGLLRDWRLDREDYIRAVTQG